MTSKAPNQSTLLREPNLKPLHYYKPSVAAIAADIMHHYNVQPLQLYAESSVAH